MILVDTSLWIDYFNGVKSSKTNELDRILPEQSVIIGDLILAEILQGFDKDHEYNTAKAALDPLSCVHLGGKPLAQKIASNFHFFDHLPLKICGQRTANVLVLSGNGNAVNLLSINI